MKNWIRKIWDALVRLIYRIPSDKWLHFIAGLIISAFFAITLGMKAAIVPAFFAGFFKEFFDKWTSGEWDWWDLVATLAGGLVIQLFIII